MKRIKVLVIAAVITICSSSVAFAEGNALNADAAVKLAIQNSINIKNQTNKIEKDKNNYNIALDASNKAAETLMFDEAMRNLANSSNLSDADKQALAGWRPLTSDQKYGLIVTRDITPLDAKYQVFEDTNEKDVLINSVTSSVYSQYSQLMNAKDILDLNQEQLNNANDINKKAQLQLQLGLISKISSLKDGENLYLSNKATFAKQQRSMDSMQMDFNRSIGEDITKRYSEYSKDNTTDIAELKSLDYYVGEALKSRVEIVNDQEYLNTKQKEYDLIISKYPNQDDKKNRTQKTNLDIAKQKLDLDKVKIQAEITNSYSSLKTKMSTLDYNKQNFEKAKKDYDIASQKYSLGMISKTDFEAAEITYKSAENTLKSQERDIWIAQLNLNYACGKGMTVSTNTQPAAK